MVSLIGSDFTPCVLGATIQGAWAALRSWYAAVAAQGAGCPSLVRAVEGVRVHTGSSGCSQSEGLSSAVAPVWPAIRSRAAFSRGQSLFLSRRLAGNNRQRLQANFLSAQGKSNGHVLAVTFGCHWLLPTANSRSVAQFLGFSTLPPGLLVYSKGMFDFNSDGHWPDGMLPSVGRFRLAD